MNQQQLSDTTALVRFANEDVPTLMQVVGLNVPELAHRFFGAYPEINLSRDFVERYLITHCSIQ